MHLFEFNDTPMVPESIRTTMLEVCELCNSGFRSFNHLVVERVLDESQRSGCTTVVELGAGTAPITRLLAPEASRRGMTLRPCDLLPNADAFGRLSDDYPGCVKPVMESVDFTVPRAWGNGSLAVVVCTFHHIPPDVRQRTLRALSESADRVMVFEPLRNTLFSAALTLTAVVPALLLPLTALTRPGRLRRFVWCWLIPVVPIIFFWDGIVSCLRQWSPATWKRELSKLGRTPEIEAGVHSLVVVW
jgi:hypothetical protein